MVESLTLVEVDEMLEKISLLEEKIKAAEVTRNALVDRYQSKIAAAQAIYESETREEREEINSLTEQLRRYAAEHVTEKKRNIKLPSGTLSFRKQPPKFFFEDLSEATADNSRLIELVKKSAPEYLKVKTVETADWAKFKAQLVIDGDSVYFKDTGELIDGLRAQVQPDKFSIKAN